MHGRKSTTRLARRMMIPFIGALVLAGAVPALASAETKWLIGGVQVFETKSITFSGSVTMSYQGRGFRVEEQCQDTGKGTVAPKGAGEITSWTVTGCTNVSNCGEGGSIVAQHLPWHTQLSTVEGSILNTATETGKNGQPDFTLKCISESLPENVACQVPNSIMQNVEAGVTATISVEVKGCSAVSIPEVKVVSSQTIKSFNAGKLSVSS